MPQFDKVKRMVRDHLKNAESAFTGRSGDNPGPTPESCYGNAFGTAAGAHAVKGGISPSEWAQLNAEISEHKEAFLA